MYIIPYIYLKVNFPVPFRLLQFPNPLLRYIIHQSKYFHPFRDNPSKILKTLSYRNLKFSCMDDIYNKYDSYHISLYPSMHRSIFQLKLLLK